MSLFNQDFPYSDQLAKETPEAMHFFRIEQVWKFDNKLHEAIAKEVSIFDHDLCEDSNTKWLLIDRMRRIIDILNQTYNRSAPMEITLVHDRHDYGNPVVGFSIGRGSGYNQRVIMLWRVHKINNVLTDTIGS